MSNRCTFCSTVVIRFLLLGACSSWGVLFGPSFAHAFHGLNAGAPVWNGNVLLTPEAAAAFAATGTDSIRVNFRLDSGATSWTPQQLAMYDQVISNARNQGLEILGLFSNETVAGGQTAWNDDADGDGLNSYVSNFASTAALLVDRYQTDIRTFELWNEPNAWSNPNYANDPQNAGGTYILPRVYAQLLSETYRSLSDQSLVGSGGVSLATGGLLAHDIGGSFSTAMPYMQQVYDETQVWNEFATDFGKAYPWDQFGYHFYISQGSPLATSQLANYINAVRAGQTSNSDPSDITITEFSWQTVGTNTQELQRDNMATAYDYLEAQPDVTNTYWYQWTDDVTGAWGLVDGAGVPKLSYHEFVSRNASATSGIIATTEHAVDDSQLSVGYSSTDLLQNLVATEAPGDTGWHPANPASSNPSDPNGLAAFTDGVGDLGSGVTGLLNDFPGDGAPAKSVVYELSGPHDLDEIRIFTGNAGNDGRIFSTTAIYTSADGTEFDLLGYFESDPSGTINSSGSQPNPNGATSVTVTRAGDDPLATDVSHLRFDFFAVSTLEGEFRDPFDGVNPFTGIDDGFAAAFVSPLVREIDVLGVSSILLAGDFNGDGSVDAADYTVWRNNLGAPAGTLANDPTGEAIGTAQYSLWKQHFGETLPQLTSPHAPVPEPQAAMLFLLAGCLLATSCRRRRF